MRTLVGSPWFTTEKTPLKQVHKALIGAATQMLSLSTVAQQTWFPSQFGATDGLGSAHKLSSALALEAAKLVKTGKTYSLGITVRTTTPA